MLNKLNPFRLPEVQVKTKEQLTQALSTTGKLGNWDVKTLTPESILNRFDHSAGSVLRETANDAWIGARKVGKFGAITGALGGAAFGLFGGLLMGITFPPSLLAIGITVAVGAAKGSALGGMGGTVLGGLYKGTKTALYLTLTSKRQRLNRQARKGRQELEKLEQRHTRKQLSDRKLTRLEYLRINVPVWEYAAYNLKTSAKEEIIEKLPIINLMDMENGAIESPLLATNSSI